jgi:hypothetical protein
LKQKICRKSSREQDSIWIGGKAFVRSAGTMMKRRKKMKVERCGLDRIEHHIQPPMPSVVTIPIEKDGRKFVIYVSVSPFLQELREEWEKGLKVVAKDIADKLEEK